MIVGVNIFKSIWQVRFFLLDLLQIYPVSDDVQPFFDSLFNCSCNFH